MKTNRVSCLLFWLVCFLSVGSVHSFLDFLFGGPCRGAESQEEEVECKVNIIYEKAGIQLRTGHAKTEAIEQGKQALGCVASIGGIDLDKKLELLGPFGFVKHLLYEQYYSSMKDDSSVRKLCQIASQRAGVQTRRSLRSQEEQKESKEQQPKSNLRRQLGTPANVKYPAATSAKYSAWANQYIMAYLSDGDTASRANLDQVTDGLLDPIATLQDDIIGDGLAVSQAIIDIICNIVGTVEVGFDPGDACRIITSSINLAAVLNAVALQELQFEQTRVNTHNILIDEAEMDATHTDAQTLVTNLTR